MTVFAAMTGVVLAQDEPDPGYWRLAQIQTQFDAWEVEYPDIFHQMILGHSGLGVAIPMVRISDNAATSEPEPRLLFHGALHANEPNGTTAVMVGIEALLKGYSSDPAVAARVDSLELFFVPILNVDGHNHVFGSEVCWQDWRKTLRDNNCNGQADFPDDGVDLNRNWDWNWDTYAVVDSSSLKYKGPYPFSEPEAAAVRDLVLLERPVVVVDYHSPVTISWRKYIFWPWYDPGSGQMGPDRAVSEDVAEIWAAATIDEDGNSYREIQAHSTLPKEQSWVYGATGTLSYIMEISDHCWWSGADVDTIGVRVARGGVALIDRVLHGPGIRGSVCAQVDGEPLVAQVKIHEMHADMVGPRLTEAEYGMYHRLTMPGDYTVTASCEGFVSESQNVTVSDHWQQLDFVLGPDLSAVVPREELRWLQTGHVLGSGGGIKLELPAGMRPALVELFDLRGHRVDVLGQDLQAGQVHELSFSNHLSGGVYLVRVKSGNRQQTGRVTIVP